jgi:DNA adenine methylase
MQSLFGFEEVRPVAPLAGYIGGKKQLSQRLAATIEQIPHTLYAEPFVGMGGVFFRRRLAPKAEFINDISGDVTTLFRILQRHYPQFVETLRFQIASRREFERLLRCQPDTLTDLERAGRFLYLQRLAFGGKVVGRSFGVDYSGGARFNVQKLAPLLEDVHERLSGVVIENLPWHDFVDRYDRPETLFFLDPPYYGCEGDYGADVFTRQDFERLAQRLAQLKARFLMTLNDTPEVRRIFSAFPMAGVGLTYTIAGGEGQKVGEVIIHDGREPAPDNLPRG